MELLVVVHTVHYMLLVVSPIQYPYFVHCRSYWTHMQDSARKVARVGCRRSMCLDYFVVEVDNGLQPNLFLSVVQHHVYVFYVQKCS